MPRAFDDTERRINKPRLPAGPPVPNQGGPVGGHAQPEITPRGVVQRRARKDEVVRPVPSSPSQTGPSGPPEAPVGRPGAPKQPEFGREVSRKYEGPMGESITVKPPKMPTPGDEAMQRQQDPGAPGQFTQGTSMQTAESRTPLPPAKTSPLGADSPIEKAAGAGRLAPGQDRHLRSIGIPDQPLGLEQQKQFEAVALQDMERFGQYEGMDDPESPPPPIRPGKNSFNPETGQWVTPANKVSPMGLLKKMRAL